MTAKSAVNDTAHKFSKNFTKVRKAIDDLPSDFFSVEGNRHSQVSSSL